LQHRSSISQQAATVTGQLYLDAAFFAEPGLIGVHPNDNTATVWLRADDLAALIREHGNPVHIAEL
jgi:Ala-tRNA(Pro) deacylase